MNEFLEQLKNIDPNDPGRWPLPVRLAVIGLVLITCATLSIIFLAWKAERPALELRPEPRIAAG